VQISLNLRRAAHVQHQLLHFVADLLPAWRKTRRTVLALGTLALTRRRQLTLTGIARGLDNRSRGIHRVKRIWRSSPIAEWTPGRWWELWPAKLFASARKAGYQ